MPSLHLLLLLLSASLLCLQTHANNFAPEGWRVIASKGIYIVEAHATLTLPKTPSPVTGYATIWLGIESEDPSADFYQCLAFSGAPDNKACSGKDWCANAYVLKRQGPPVTGRKLHLAPGTRMTSHYQKQGNNMVTWIEVNGRTVSSTSTPYAKVSMAYTQIECHTHPAGLIPGHTWTDLTIKLSAPDKSPKHIGEGTSRDGGMTWYAARHNVPAWNCRSDKDTRGGA